MTMIGWTLEEISKELTGPEVKLLLHMEYGFGKSLLLFPDQMVARYSLLIRIENRFFHKAIMMDPNRTNPYQYEVSAGFIGFWFLTFSSNLLQTAFG